MNHNVATYFCLVLLVSAAVAVLFFIAKKKYASKLIPDNIMNPQAWEVGPIFDGVNVSRGVALHPVACDGGWCIDIPLAGAGSLHYVTVPTGSLVGKTKVTLVCEFIMADGVRICPVKSPDSPSLLTLYFQRRGDNWSGVGKYETYRWYASFDTQMDLTANQYTLEARFDEEWTAIISSSRATQLEAFNAALANAGRIGFVLGGGDGLGHGVDATGSVKMIVKSFVVN